MSHPIVITIDPIWVKALFTVLILAGIGGTVLTVMSNRAAFVIAGVLGMVLGALANIVALWAFVG